MQVGGEFVVAEVAEVQALFQFGTDGCGAMGQGIFGSKDAVVCVGISSAHPTLFANEYLPAMGVVVPFVLLEGQQDRG